MDWHKIPEFDSVSSSDENPFVGSQVQPIGKVTETACGQLALQKDGKVESHHH